MDKLKENVLNDFIIMIKKSWTYEKLTDKEKSFLEKAFNDYRTQNILKGTYKQRWEILQGIYAAFLHGVGYTDFNWRNTNKEV